MKELVLKKCLKCGTVIEILKKCNCKNCGIECCNESMINIEPNTVEAAIEKHIPNYEIIDNTVEVTVNHVMEEDHYIEWIALLSEDKFQKQILKIAENAKVSFPYIKGSKIYAYCNKHGLWSNNIE